MNFKEIEIKTSDNLSLPSKFYACQTTENKLGTLIYYHGGGLIFGVHDDLPKEYIDVLTKRFDVLLVSYRLIPESSLEEIFTDISHIYNYAHSINEDVYVLGRSAGGYLSYLTAKHFNVKGAIIFYGYYNFNHPDFNDLPKDQTKYSKMLSPSIETMNIRNFKTTNEQPNPRFLLYLYYRHKNLWTNKLGVDLNDPKYFLTDDDLKEMPKTFLVHCSNDPDVPYQYSVNANKTISNNKLVTVNKNEHDFDRTVTDESLNIYKEAVKFF